MSALAIPSTFTINVVIDLSSVEAVLVRVLSSFLQLTDNQPTNSNPEPVSSLPATAPASAPSPVTQVSGTSSAPEADRPKRTRRTKVEIAAAREAEKHAAGTGPTPVVTTVPAAAPAPASASSMTETVRAVAAQPPVANESDLFGAAPVAAPAGAASEAQVLAFRQFIMNTFLPNPKGGNDEYHRIRGQLGNPLLSDPKAVTLAVLSAWETALCAQIGVPKTIT